MKTCAVNAKGSKIQKFLKCVNKSLQILSVYMEVAREFNLERKKLCGKDPEGPMTVIPNDVTP